MVRDPESVGIVGLGYVGLPLAVAFSKQLQTIGFDVNEARIRELQRGLDRNGETPVGDLQESRLTFTSDPSQLAQCDAILVAVPTPVDAGKRPDLSFLRAASRLVGEVLAKRGPGREPALVIFESTVYPGCTQEVCLPILEAVSGSEEGEGFHLAYSPERINPGDAGHTLANVTKVVGADTDAVRDVAARLYGRIVHAGIHRASSIRVAEAAKVIENTQRDLNIALMNELTILFHRIGIDAHEVREASATKWNFLPFRPGLVGGHCIPEDPYYLTHKAEEVGYYPEVILAGRRINDEMGRYVARETVKLLAKTGRLQVGARVLVLGITFKEDVKDVRNTRVVDIDRELKEFGVVVEVHDPVAGEDAFPRLGFEPAPREKHRRYDAVIIAVPHAPFRQLSVSDLLAMLRDGPGPGVVIDVKAAFPKAEIHAGGALHWSM